MDGMVEICIDFLGETEREISLELFTVGSDTATSGADYLSVSTTIAFSAENTTFAACREILVIQDSILEDEESFLVFISSSDPAVVIGLSSAEVLILDSDRKLEGVRKGGVWSTKDKTMAPIYVATLTVERELPLICDFI